jgi:hypothetical protein
MPSNKALVPTARLCRAAPGTAPRGTAPDRCCDTKSQSGVVFHGERRAETSGDHLFHQVSLPA